MIAARCPRTAAFSARQRRGARIAAFVALGAFAVLANGCAVERETTLARASRLREVQEQRAEKQQLERELNVLQRDRAEAVAALATARHEAVSASAELRTALADLRFDVERLHRAETDLAEARVRAQEVEKQLAPLRQAEAALRDQEALRAAAAAKSAQLAPQLEAAQKEAAAKEAELGPRLAAVQQKLAALQKVAASIAAAEAALAEAAKTMAPPAAK